VQRRCVVRYARVGFDELSSNVVANRMSFPAIVGLLLALGDPPNPANAANAANAAPTSTQTKARVTHVMDENERVALEQTDNVRLSLPTQGDLDAWASPGLRLQLGYGFGSVYGTGPALSWKSKAVMLRPSLRLDRRWSIGVAMLYGGGPSGIRWSITAEPTLHLWRQLSISAGLGYGGLMVSSPNAPTGRLVGANEAVSRNLADDEKLNSCEGAALSAGLRAEYLMVVGPLFATGPYAQIFSQWTRCEATFGRSDPETGTPVTLTQWWQQSSTNFGWWLAWR